MVHADRPGAPLPTRAASAFSKSPVEMPFRQRMGISTSRLCDRRAYRGRIDGEYRMRPPSVASRSRTRGWRTVTGPMPVMISRSGRWPWRTTRSWPVSVLRSVCFARNSATSASTACASSARAPLRRISVRESVKAPGWASLMTLPSDTAYHSFIGEVEALNTTTIRRLIPSARHQLPAIAPNRIRGLLFGQGITNYNPLHKNRRKNLEQLRTGDGRSVPAHLKSQILREIDRLELVLRQIGEVETERDEILQLAQPSSPAALLMRLKGIGAEFATV